MLYLLRSDLKPALQSLVYVLIVVLFAYLVILLLDSVRPIPRETRKNIIIIITIITALILFDKSGLLVI